MVEGYRRRRAWTAFHSGYGVAGTIKNPKIEDLLGRKPKAQAMSPDALLKAVRRIKKAMEAKFGDGE